MSGNDNDPTGPRDILPGLGGLNVVRFGPRTLSAEARAELIGRHPDWSLVSTRSAITRYFRFRDFTQAFAFMTAVAAIAARDDHYPEWSNAYDRVEILLTTHDAGGLTERDVIMVERIDEISRIFLGQP